MAEAIRLISSANQNPVLSLSLSLSRSARPSLIPRTKKLKLLPHSRSQSHTCTIISSSSSTKTKSRKKQNSISKSESKNKRIPQRPLITISTSDGRWLGKWNCEYVVSLQDLCLEDLVEDEHNQHPLVSINLSIQKHASFGFSVDGRIITSFTRKCSNCSSPYSRKIDVSFNVWVLQSSRENGNSIQLPDIGGDPSVIYVKPGYQADLDSLIQDTIRLNTTLKDICSKSCEKSEPTIQYIGAKNTASMDKRWGKLLELRNANSIVK